MKSNEWTLVVMEFPASSTHAVAKSPNLHLIPSPTAQHYSAWSPLFSFKREHLIWIVQKREKRDDEEEKKSFDFSEVKLRQQLMQAVIKLVTPGSFFTALTCFS